MFACWVDFTSLMLQSSIACRCHHYHIADQGALFPFVQLSSSLSLHLDEVTSQGLCHQWQLQETRTACHHAYFSSLCHSRHPFYISVGFCCCCFLQKITFSSFFLCICSSHIFLFFFSAVLQSAVLVKPYLSKVSSSLFANSFYFYLNSYFFSCWTTY